MTRVKGRVPLRDVFLRVRVTRAEMTAIKRAAAEQGMTMAELVRKLGEPYLEKQNQAKNIQN